MQRLTFNEQIDIFDAKLLHLFLSLESISKVKETFKIVRKLILSRVTEVGDNILDKSKIDIKVLKKNFDDVKKDKKSLAKLEKDFKSKMGDNLLVKEIRPEVDAKDLASSFSPKSSGKVSEVLLEEKDVTEPEIDAVSLDGSVACVVKVNQREYTENKKGFT